MNQEIIGILIFTGIFVLIPLGGMAFGLVTQWLKTKERMLAIERGVALPPDPTSSRLWDRIQPKDAWEKAADLRVAGLICMATGAGLAVLFAGLSLSLPSFPKGVIGAAAIPFLIGVALFFEYNVRSRELGPRVTPPASTPPQPGAAE